MKRKVTKEIFENGRDYAQEVVNALNEGVSPWHAVEHCKQQLRRAGFSELHENDEWEIKPGESYFFSRNGTTICGFTVGKGCAAGGPELFKVVGCHTDSPVIRLAPISKLQKHGFDQMAIQVYGGGQWLTWFDRDLTLAGRVVVNKGGKIESRLWYHKQPLLRIPHLAIHMKVGEERETFTPNKEIHLRPVIATTVIDQLMDETEEEEEKKLGESPYETDRKHLKSFLQRIAEDLKCSPDEIIDFELSTLDASPSCLIGLHQEFISSGRLDNLCSTFCALHALIERKKDHNSERDIDMVVFYDHEEIGSQTHQGADTTLLMDAMKRIYFSLDESAGISYSNKSYDRMMACIHRSLLVSADMSHAIHPNYGERHQENHQPHFHKGIVIKTNPAGRYMTDSASEAILLEIARQADIPMQEFCVRQDMPCGTTIGPLIASQTGIKTIDIGAPQLAMHSAREFMATTDTLYYKELFKAFYRKFTTIKQSLLDS